MRPSSSSSSSGTEVGNGGERDETRGDSRVGGELGFEQSGRGRGRWRREILQGWNWGRQIFQSETWKHELILSSSFFWGGGGREGGGWVAGF